MAYQENDTLREIISQARITFAGAGAKIQFMSGPQPAAGGAETTVLATGTFGAVVGTSVNGVLTWGAITQNNALHVTGTPVWARVMRADNIWVWDYAIPADMGFSGTITNGVDFTPGTCTMTVGG